MKKGREKIKREKKVPGYFFVNELWCWITGFKNSDNVLDYAQKSRTYQSFKTKK